MTGRQRQAGFVAIALCVAAQGAALLALSRGHGTPGGWRAGLVAAAAAAGLAATWLWSARTGLRAPAAPGARRGGLRTLALAQAGLLAVAAMACLAPRQEAADAARERARLTAELERVQDLPARLLGALDAAAAAARDTTGASDAAASDADPYRPLASAQAAWRRAGVPPARYPLEAVLWREGERVAWSADALPAPAPDAEAAPAGAAAAMRPAAGWGVVTGGSGGWIWRRFYPLALPGATPAWIELQARLTSNGSPVDISSTVVSRAPVGPALRFESAGERLIASRDLALPDPDAAGAPVWLRVSLARAATGPAAGRQAAAWLALGLLLWVAAAGGAGWALAGGRGLLVALGLARLLWLGADLWRWLGLAVGAPAWSAGPGTLASLLDPAYFATPAGGGLLASTADALLTVALVAAMALVLARRLERPAGAAPSSAPALGPGARLAGAATAGAVAAGVLVALSLFVGAVAENANPRLIGPQIPYRTLPFWALHLTLLLAGGSLLVLLSVAARRWRARVRGAAGTLGVALGAGAVAALATGLAPAARVALPLLALLLWWAARGARSSEAFPRRLAQLAPLLVAVLWNYLALSEAYARAEMIWLERKGEEIVQPQDDWIRFLIADTLAEMAEGVSAAQTPPVASGPLAAGLWRNWTAYELWRRSALRDLGLPCLVELRDGEGAGVSLYAAGFFRDFGYEVAWRSSWDLLEATPAGRVMPGSVHLQTERRRYPAGEETVLRGEIARTDGPGWLLLELPVASRRIATLMDRLAGQAPTSGIGGYLPRTEVDRSLLLVRGDENGWLDAGSGPFPRASSESVVRALREGRQRWGSVHAGGADYRCLWRPAVPAAPGRAAEGFLLGVEVPGLGARLLDVSRLALLDLLLLAGLGLPWAAWRLARRRRGPTLGFQERFLMACLGLGLLPLVFAGVFVDRLNLQLLASGARRQARQGLEAAVSQLQGLLAEQARALAGSEYIAGLLASRLAGQRPLGPFAARQGMVFDADGRLLLDETLSNLDAGEAATLLAKARGAPLIVWEDGDDLYLGLVIPVDLAGLAAGSPAGTAAAGTGAAAAGVAEAGAAEASATGASAAGSGAAVAAAPRGAGATERLRDGFFFYRQRIGSDLLVGLAEIIQGEVTLRVGGEVVLASHPERVFSGATPMLLPPTIVSRLQRYPNSPYVAATSGRLGFTGSAALPTIATHEGWPALRPRQLPASLTVGFPARERDFARQREQMVLFLMGLATLIFLLAALLGLLLTWRIFGPVRMLVTATRRLAAGDFAAPLPEEGRHEIGTLSAAFRTMRDDLALTQRELARRERFLATVLERVPVGVAIFDPAGDVVALNPAAASLLGREQGAGPAAPADAELAARARLLRDKFRARLAPGEQGEAEVRPADGRRTLRGRLAPLRLPEGSAHTLMVFEDVTEFLATKSLALQAELARQVAHEIKNPLTPIQLSMQFLEQAHRDRAPDFDRLVGDTVRQVLAQVSLLREIATEFSLLGRPGALATAPVDWPALARDVIGRYQAGDGGPRVTVAKETVPPVLAHAESLAKVMANLMENSLQACAVPAELELDVLWRVQEAEVTLHWADNGPGLPAEVAVRLFEPYFSTKSQGTGLGLAICRSLLDRMGGTITLRNRDDGSGAVAEVTLPRAPRVADGTAA